MAAGLEVFNNNGHYVIDGTYRNLVLKETRDVYMETGSETSVSFTGENPYVAIGQTGNAHVGLWWVDVSGNTYTYHFVLVGNSRNVKIHIFDNPSGPTTNSGLHVIDNSGNTVFQSDADYLRPYEFLSMDPNGTQASYPTNIVAVLGLINNGIYTFPLPKVDTARILSPCISVDGGTVDFQPLNIATLNNYVGPYTAYGPAGDIMVCNASTF